jgi:cholesterol oxidase
MTDATDYLDRDHFDALVIGSGFGGAVAACRLAQAGIDVAVVERGRRWRPGSFPRDLSRLDDGWLWLCDHGLYDVKPLNDILAVQAAGYGGGSLVYANVAMRPPQEVFDKAWPEPYSRETLDPYYDLVSHMLDVRPVPVDPHTGELPPKTRFMARTAEQLGASDAFCHPNLAVTFDDEGPDQRNRFGVPQRGCQFVGECDIGCNVGAKNSLDHNYLAVAEQRGAAVGLRTEAVYVARSGDGYRVRLREHGHPEAGRDGIERDVTAQSVFVCAGAIGTTELLLRSREQYGTLPDLPATLGRGYSGNGDFLSFGRGMRDRFEPGSGPTITTALLMHTKTADEEQWFVLEDGGFSAHIAKLVSQLDMSQLPARVATSISEGARRTFAQAREVATVIAEDADTAVLLAMGGDRAEGRIELRGRNHRLHVTWDVPSNDPLYAAERAVSASVIRAGGGKPFVAPTWGLFRQPVTVHNLGGAAMSPDPKNGVVDLDGEVFGHPGLFVLDGAVLPGATGANPSLTIAAVAERCIETAIRRLTGSPDWVAPERAEAEPRAVPEDAVVRAVVARPGPDRIVPGVSFAETMRGSIQLPEDGGSSRRRRVAMRFDAHVPDLQAFLDDPVHEVRLAGTVQVDGLTRQPVRTDGATLHLMVPAVGGPQRTMDYTVPFTDDSGTEWLLRGTKHIQRGWHNGPWHATTVLYIAIVPPESRYESLKPTGRAVIATADVFRLLGGLRATGTKRRSEAARTVIRFGSFFAESVLRAYLSPTGRRSVGRGRR